MRTAATLLVWAGLALTACSKSHAPSAASSQPSLSPSPATPDTSAEPGSTASTAMGPAEPAATAPAAALPESQPPLPDIKVNNIGMHIGGGPNDNVSKAPIRDSVKPHFDAFRRCWRHVQDPDRKGGDFGVDLLIPHEGGKAEVNQPRTAIKGEAFTPCVLEAFQAIDFLKPRTGRTTVSYSLRFSY